MEAMERLSTDPTPPSPVRTRDVIAFLWHAAAEGESRRVRAQAAMDQGDLPALAAIYREAEFQGQLALWMVREARGGSLQGPRPIPLPAPRPSWLDRLRGAWRGAVAGWRQGSGIGIDSGR